MIMASSAKITNRITDLLIGAVLVSALLGTIVNQFNTMAEDGHNFTDAQMALLSVLGIIVVIGVFRWFTKK